MLVLERFSNLGHKYYPHILLINYPDSLEETYNQTVLHREMKPVKCCQIN